MTMKTGILLKMIMRIHIIQFIRQSPNLDIAIDIVALFTLSHNVFLVFYAKEIDIGT